MNFKESHKKFSILKRDRRVNKEATPEQKSNPQITRQKWDQYL